MDAAAVKEAIEAGIPGATAEVSTPRNPDHAPDDPHYAAVVVAEAFEGHTLVDQHRMVYDALGEAMTREIHAIELKTYTPD
ncbi:UNVERIFIED_CONTAM: BolA family transcriptional regulator, partial [Euhalothece sp. KZN 001]